MKRILMIAGVALALASCGGGGSAISKDTKADFQMEHPKMQELSSSMDDAVRKPYMDKIIEMKGYVTQGKKAVGSASPNKFSFHLSPTATEDGANYVICYTDTDPASIVGKQVTVKGKFDYAGVITLDDCVAY